MNPFRDETELAAALAEMRPAIRPEFAAELDARAVAGFPRASRFAIPRLANLRNRLRSTPPRRLLGAGGAVAVTAVVIATAVVATSETGPPASSTPADSGRLGAAGPQEGASALPHEIAAPATGKASSGASGAEGGVGGHPAIPLETAPRTTTGPYASGARERDVERSAEIVLGAEPNDVRADAAKVFDAVHAANGIVLRSSIRDGGEGVAGADFELLIPSGRVGDAMASFSAIAEVRSRHESTQDITAPTVGVDERLQDSHARVEGLLGQLADASTDEERAAVEAQLRDERLHAAALRSRLSDLQRRANLSHVSLQIETGRHSNDEGAGGGWGIGDGLDDAGRILAVAAGVTLVGLAILAPFALIFLLAWLGRRAWLRRARAHALG